MRPRLRAAGILAVLGAGTLLLSAAVPPNAPALFSAPAGFDPANPNAQPVTQTSTEPPPGAVTPKTAVQELRTMGALQLDSTGTVRSITAAPGGSLGANGDEFVKRYAGAFGLTKSHSLVRSSSVGVPGGDQVVRYQQTSGGLPILGGEVVITIGSNASVRAAITDTTPLAPSGGSAKLDPAAARAKAMTASAQKYSLDQATLGSQASLWLYDATKDGAPGAPQLRPTYWVKITEQEHEVASVLLDGIDGSIKLIASEHHSGKRRSVCDLGNTRVNLNSRTQYVCNEYSALGTQSSSRHEGSANSSNADVNDAYNRLGAAYDYFKNTFGRDSYDGRGVTIRATVRACEVTSSCPFQNAFWEGYQFVFGQGWATDDVAAHEYTHAVTEHASSLYYWHESGAINEALSDIFGEFIDLATPGDGTDDINKRWLIGEDLPAGPNFPGGAIRNMADPRAKGDPSEVRGFNWDDDQDLSDNGGVHTNSGPANRAAKLIYDGGEANVIGSPLPGLGPVKAAHLWYRVMHLLPSGANYAQLGNVISSSCRQLIGHWGFTLQDCQQTVDLAMLAIWSGNTYRTPLPYPNLCEYLQPPTALFSDDMEQGTTKWTFSNNHHWQMIPTQDIAYSYAKSGKGSINGWNNRGGAGHGTYVETAQPIVLPAGSTPKLYFSHSLIVDANRYQGDPVVIAQINDGTGWQPLALGGFVPGAIHQPTKGYENQYLDLTSYAGRSIKLRFQLQTATSKFIDWYLDDVWVFTCGNTTGPAADHYGFHTTGGMSLNWGHPTWVAQASPSGSQSFHWELSYSPAIPGAPTIVEHVDGWNSLLLAQADPATTYKVTIAARTEDGQLGQPVVMTVTPHSPIVCPYPGVSTVTPPFTGRRPIPGAPIGQCFRVPTPRR